MWRALSKNTRSAERMFLTSRRCLSSINLSSPKLKDKKVTEEELLMTEEEYKEMRRQKYAEIELRKGRGFSDPWDFLQDLEQGTADKTELPDWTPDLVSRKSQERLHILGQVVTLDKLANEIALPPAPNAHPADGSAKLYALQRKRNIEKYVLDRVKAKIGPNGEFEEKLMKVKAMTDWDDKQDAIDEIFEQIEYTLRNEETILGKNPLFGSWVAESLEKYLKSLQEKGKEKIATAGAVTKSISEQDREALPTFMDCYDASVDDETVDVPHILRPLKEHDRSQNLGRMVEEWQLAARKNSKRILLRQCTREIARIICSNADSANKSDNAGDSSNGDGVTRVFVHGRKGTGKSAALAATVAMARKSGHLVLYLPDGDRLTKLTYYVQPNTVRKGMYDMPMWAQIVAQDFVANHENDLQDVKVEKSTVGKYCTPERLERFCRRTGTMESTEFSAAFLLQSCSINVDFASMCYSAVMEVLTNQKEKPFTVVMDEYNCYHQQPGHVFHEEYDPKVKRSIPYERIDVYELFLNGLGLLKQSSDEEEEFDKDFDKSVMQTMKYGNIVVGITESHAVPRKITDTLVAKASATKNVHCVHVPRMSKLEVEHVLSNYESIGLGKLRLDQGETVMDEQEVAYLHSVSSGVAQELMEACIMD